MKIIIFVTFWFLLFSCNSQTSNTKIFEEKLKKGLEDNAFRLNSSFNIIEFKIINVQPVRLDSLYRELCYERLNKLFADLKKNKSKDYNSIDLDTKYNDLLTLKRGADTALNGNFVRYYIKGTFFDVYKRSTNILYDTVLSYFDNNNNLLYNKLHFDN